MAVQAQPYSETLVGLSLWFTARLETPLSNGGEASSPETPLSFSPSESDYRSKHSKRKSLKKNVKLKNMLYHTARINCLAWSLDNTMVATGSLDTCVIVYDISKPASSRITIKGSHLGGVAFTDNRSIVSSGEDACVRVWRLTSQ